MAEFLTTFGTSYNIEKIIIDATSTLILVSPYLQISKTFYERLKDASHKGVVIKILFGKDQLKNNEMKMLTDLDSVELFYFENLHAKCYFNEKKMVITSMNMYEFSEKNNREMGVLIDHLSDKELFEKAVTETHSIIQSSTQISVRSTVKNPAHEKNKSINGKGKPININKVLGFCVRCQKRITYDPVTPFCPDCFSVWAIFQNHEHKEKYCHRCGEEEPTTMSRPQCYNCFEIWRKS